MIKNILIDNFNENKISQLNKKLNNQKQKIIPKQKINITKLLQNIKFNSKLNNNNYSFVINNKINREVNNINMIKEL